MTGRSLFLPRGALVSAGLAALLLGCRSPEPLVFDVRVEVTRQDGREPVAAALVRAHDESATTDARGRSLLHVRGRAGDRVPVSVTCPAGSAPASGAEVILPGAPSASHDDAPTVRLVCPLAAHDAVVLVHAAGAAASLPIAIDGVVVGQTDSLGFAHVHVRAGSRSEFEVSLDTSAAPGLSPANPTRRFAIDRADELFVFDAAFEPVPRKGRRQASKRRGPPQPVE